uniref:Uncharacterized protein n=1 Tax=Anguilla anguilla TaxID=7936 RepID=A0A0E9T8M1_ANGAN
MTRCRHTLRGNPWAVCDWLRPGTGSENLKPKERTLGNDWIVLI